MLDTNKLVDPVSNSKSIPLQTHVFKSLIQGAVYLSMWLPQHQWNSFKTRLDAHWTTLLSFIIHCVTTSTTCHHIHEIWVFKRCGIEQALSAMGLCILIVQFQAKECSQHFFVLSWQWQTPLPSYIVTHTHSYNTHTCTHKWVWAHTYTY